MWFIDLYWAFFGVLNNSIYFLYLLFYYFNILPMCGLLDLIALDLFLVCNQQYVLYEIIAWIKK